MKILIVDDSKSAQLKTHEILSKYGKCDQAYNGAEAVECFISSLKGADPYDLIIMDVVMPKMNGFDAAKQIKQLEHEKNIPENKRSKIVMLTSKSEPKNMMKAHFEIGVKTYITKPFQEDTLIEAIRNLDFSNNQPSSFIMRRITDQYPDHKQVRLGIGEGGIYIHPTIVTTVLGSCVSVAFFCRDKKIGALFHALLATMPPKEKKNIQLRYFSFVDTAINHIIYSFRRRGVKKNQIEAKVFGGAQSNVKGILQPGTKNIMTAYEVLAEHNIKIAASDVGGDKGRNLIFVTDTGEVFIKNHLNSIIGTGTKN